MSSFVSTLSSDRINRLIIVYPIGIFLIACISIGTHFLVDRIVENGKQTASKINIVDKQRTYSQRSAYLLMVANRTGNASNLTEYKNVIDEFEKNHASMTHGDVDLGLIPLLPQEVHDIYFKGHKPLDTELRKHIAKLREFYDRMKAGERISTDELAPVLGFAQSALLTDLENVVKAYQASSENRTDTLVAIQSYSILLILLALIVEAMIVFYPMLQRLKHNAQQLQKTKSYDPLTDTLNRTSFYSISEYELRHARKYERNLSILLMEIDQLMMVITVHGRRMGDKLLRHFAINAAKNLREFDKFGRIGEQRFALLLPDTSIAEAQEIAEKICYATRSNPLELNDKTTINITTSIGVTCASNQAERETIDTLLVRGDEALYRAKQNGRDRYEFSTPTMPNSNNPMLKVWTSAFSKTG